MATHPLNSLDYSQWTTTRYCSKIDDYVPDFQHGQRNPYHPAYVWDYYNCTWVFDANYIAELSGAGYGMVAGYELAPGTSAVQYIVMADGSGGYSFVDSSNARLPSSSTEEPSTVTTFTPKSAPTVSSPTVYVPNMTYQGSRTPVTVTLYGEGNNIIGTGTGYGDEMIVDLDWGHAGTGQAAKVWFSGYAEYHGSYPDVPYSWPWYQKTFMFVDDNGAINIILIDQEYYEVNYFTNASSSWVHTRIDSGTYNIHNYGDAKMDLNDNSFHVLFIDFQSSSIAGIGYITNKTGSWVETLILTPASGYPVYNGAIAVDDSGYAHMVYIAKNSTQYDIKYINNVAGSWSSPELIDTVASVDWSEISLEVDGATGLNAVFAYKTGSNAAAVLRTSGTWGSPFLISSVGGNAINVVKDDTYFFIYHNDPTIGYGIKERKYLKSTMASAGTSTNILGLGNNYPLATVTRFQHAAQADSNGRIVLSIQYQNGIGENAMIAYSDDSGDNWTTLNYTGFGADDWGTIFTTNSTYDRGIFFGTVMDVYDDALYLLNYSVSTFLTLDRITYDYNGDEATVDGFFADGTQQTPVSGVGISGRNAVYVDIDNSGSVDLVALFNPPLTADETIIITVIGGQYDQSASNVPANTTVGILDDGIGTGTLVLQYDAETNTWVIVNTVSFTDAVIIISTKFGSGHDTTDEKGNTPFLIPWLIVD